MNKDKLAVLALVFVSLLPFASAPVIADQSITGWYLSPYYSGISPTVLFPTVGEAIAADVVLYKHIWSVAPYGSLNCGFPTTFFGNGIVTGRFAEIQYTGDCGGSNDIFGTLSCAGGYQLSGNVCTPTNAPIPPKNRGVRCQPCEGGGGPTNNGSDPVNGATGNVFESQTDEIGGGPFPLRIERYYNSNSTDVGSFGAGWSSYYERRLVLSTAVSSGGTTFKHDAINNAAL
ncbi:MAG: DUF6531 domain-containing protein [Gammaproteobacteria bacterium]